MAPKMVMRSKLAVAIVVNCIRLNRADGATPKPDYLYLLDVAYQTNL